MKIISGKWGGQSLQAKSKIRSTSALRPTSNKVREAIFDILEARVISSWSEMSVLDLFAGSGAFGFESLSRGCASVDFVEHHPATARELRKLIEGFEVATSAQVHCQGALEAISELSQSYDLVFLDPPYGEDWVVPTMNRLKESSKLKDRGIVIVEHTKRELMSPLEGFWKCLTARRYGDTMVSFFCDRESEQMWEEIF